MSKSMARARAKWRRSIKSKPTYDNGTYRRRIKVHAETLDKYLGQFGRWLAIWLSRSEGRLRITESVFGRDRMEDVLAGEQVRISEVFRLSEAYDFSREFAGYLLGKTHLSYELGKSKPEPRRAARYTRTGPYHDKLGEFVYIILAEYIVLHNYQFVSKTKVNGINSIDQWLKNA